MKTYYKTPEEAEKAMQKEYYRPAINGDGVIGGNDCPPNYQGGARRHIPKIPESQKVK